MKLKNYFLSFLALGIFSLTAQAQEQEGPMNVGHANSMYQVPSLASRVGSLIPSDDSPKVVKDKRHFGNQVVPGKDAQKQDDYFVRNRSESEQSVRVSPPSIVFDAANTGGSPSDPDLAIGPNHVFVVWNTGFRIFDKSGNPLTGQLDDSNIFTNADTCCDLTVSYDNVADRWVVSILSATAAGNSFSGLQIAVSDGPDPLTAGWNSYQFNMSTDYQKLSVWSDGYYISANKAGGEVIHVLERDAMLAGDPSPQIQGFGLPGIVTNGFYSPQAFHVTDDNLPAVGNATFVYMQDDAWGGVASDHLKLWTVNVDWVTPANSTVTLEPEMPVTPFIGVFDGGSFVNLQQPGGGTQIDALQATIMNQAHFRKFAAYNAAVFNFVVDTDASGGELAGIRWFELRQTGDGQPWTLFQEGTYTAPDGRHAWHASLALNADGNIGMGYTSMAGPTTPNPTDFRVSSYYTGRFDGDALGAMTVVEELISAGNANIGGTRYGDYSKIDVDPSNDQTFWFINDYNNGGGKAVVGVFNLEPNTATDDIGVIAITTPIDGELTANEDVTITIRNFGINDITNPDVQYTIDSGAPVVETLTVVVPAESTIDYTFTVQSNLSVDGTTYNICAKTNLTGDTDTGNDEFCKMVTNAAIACIPEATAGCNLDGIKKFVLNTIDADDGEAGCNTEPAGSPQGYADRTNLSTTLSNLAGSNVYTLQAQQNWAPDTNPPFNPGDEGFAVWIDFDDSATFDADELLIDSAFQLSTELEGFTLTIPVGAPLGSHTLRAKAIDITGGDDLTDPCAPFAYGEVHDYTVVIDDILGLENPAINEAEFTVVSLPNNQFDLTLTTSFEGKAAVSVHDITGRVLAFNVLEKEGDNYKYALDMSYVSSGIYIIKIGDVLSKTYRTTKIIVD